MVYNPFGVVLDFASCNPTTIQSGETSEIVLFSARARERWAWYTLLYLPIVYILIPLLFLTVELVPGRPPPQPIVTLPVFAVIALIALFLPYRKFFPKK